MHTARPMTTAFLRNRDQYLIMERSADRAFGPGGWAGVGGHIEPGELRDPHAACLREIEEETGFAAADVENLHLKYIVLRLKEREVRQQYVYFGRTLRRDFTDTPEGRLHWMDLAAVLQRPASKTTHFIIEHYLAGNKDDGDLYVGTFYDRDGEAAVDWTPLRDWES